jgi:hypothetical protein
VNTDTPEGLIKSFGNKTRGAINLFAKKYAVDYVCPEGIMPADMLDGLLNAVETKTQAPVYVVIDEYDHFANELLSFRIDMFKDSVSKTGFVRKWFEILKEHTVTSVKRIFATGVSPVTLDSLTSGFNIASDITMNARFNEMMGLLTIDRSEAGRVRLKVPNEVMKGLYFEYFIKHLADAAKYRINTDAIEDAIEDIATKGVVNEELNDSVSPQLL